MEAPAIDLEPSTQASSPSLTRAYAAQQDAPIGESRVDRNLETCIFGLVAEAVDPNAPFGALLVSMLLGTVFGLFWRRRHRGGFPLAPVLAGGTTLVLALWAVLEGPTTW